MPAAVDVLPTNAPRFAWASPFAVALLLAAIALALTTAVVDSDFWWHLASGRWIWEHRALPEHDPFGIALKLGDAPGRRDFVLRAFWLGQVIFHAVHALAGLHGIIVLRAAILTTMFAIVYWRLRGFGAPPPLAAALVGAVAHVFIVDLAYVGDRPQLWTSLLLVVLLEVLDRVWRGERIAAWGFPALMIVWANLHAGFVIGDGVAGLYALARIRSIRSNARPFAFVAAAILASGLNPCGFEAVAQALGTSVDAQSLYWRTITEWQSLFDHSSAAGIARQLPVLVALSAFALAGALVHVARPRAIRPERIALAVLATVIGVRAIRFVPFFAVVAAETAALGLAPLASRAAKATARAPRWVIRASSVVAVLAVASHFGVLGWRSTALPSPRPFDTSLEPAVRFMKNNGLHGALFNEHDDGGFLLNGLAPDVRVFIDGRDLSIRVFDLYRLAVDSPEAPGPFGTGRPAYKEVLALAKANLVLLPGADRSSGTLIRLTEVLLRDPEWSVVYADDRVVLFVRGSGEFSAFAWTHALPASVAYENMLSIAVAAARQQGGHAHMMPNWKLPAAVALARSGREPQALPLVLQYLEAIPDDPVALALRAEIGGGPH